MARWLKLAALFAGAMILLLVLAAAAAYGWLRTDGGRHWIEARIAAASGGQVRIKGLEGPFPFEARAGRLTLWDEAGPWLTAEDLHLAMRPAALLRLHLAIDTLSARRIDIVRLPDGGDASDDDAAPTVPRLPVSVEIGTFEAPDVTLSAAAAGQEARVSLAGSGTLSEGSARLSMALRRLDAPGEADADIRYDGRRLAIELDLSDPGGLIARTAGAPSPFPVTLHATGEGPLADWRGDVDLDLGEAKSRLALAVQAGRLTVSGSLDPRPLLQPPLAVLLPEPLQIEGALRIEEPRTLERIALAAGGAHLAFTGALRLEDKTGSGHGEFLLPDAAVLRPLLGLPVRGAASGTIEIESTEDGQSATLTAHAETLGIAGYEAARLVLDGNARRAVGTDEVRVEGTARATGVATDMDPELPLLPVDLTLDFDASVLPRERTLIARRLNLSGAGVELGFTGTATTDGALDGVVRLSVPEIRSVAQLAGLDWSGGLALESNVISGEGLTRFEMEGAWREPRTGIAELDAVLGSSVRLSATGTARHDGGLEVSRAHVGATAVELLVSGRAARAGPLDVMFELNASDLAALSAASGRPLAGTARIAGHVTGTAAAPSLAAEVSSPSLSFAGTDLSDLRIAAELTDLRTAPRGSASGGLAVAGVRGDFDTRLVLKDRILSFDDLRVRANGATMSGRLSVQPETGAITGTADLTAPDLSPWSALAGLPLAGSARGTVRLRPDGGATIEATGSNLALGDVEAARLRLDASLARWHGPLSGRIDLAAETLSAGAALLDTASLRIEPKAGAYLLRFAGSGTAAAAFTAEAEGTYEPDAQRLRLAALTGTFAGKPVRLRSATSLGFGAGIAAAPFELSWGQSTLAGEFAMGARLSGGLRAENLPIADVAALAGVEDVSGTARATIALSGSRSDPHARLEATIADLAFAGAAGDSPAGDLEVTGELSHDSLDWRAELTSATADLSFAASGALPVSFNPPFAVALAPSGPLRAELDGSGDVTPIFALLGIDEDRASGRYLIDLTLAGTLANPLVTGSARVENGRYENFASGAVLQDIALQARGVRDRLDLTISARDSEDGRIEGGGSLRLSGADVAAMDLTARLAGLRALRRDDVRARASGDLRLAGPLDGMVLSGEVTLDRMLITLPEHTRTAAPVLDVVEINAPEPDTVRLVARSTATGSAEPAMVIGLDLAAKLPQVEVTGRGLRSQWHGKIAVAGTTAAPQLTGEIRLDRGTFQTLGKTFTLVEGQIVFDGGPELDPSLRVIAEKDVRDAVARATLTGSLSAPILDFSARPELPVDEVLARLLFDKGAGQVGAAEALQLAQLAATLQSGGATPAMMQRFEQKLGLDRIDISTVEVVDEESGDTSEAPALSLGKNISEDVRVGVEQGVQAGTGGVTVEVDLGKNLSVESRVGTEGRSGVGLKWKYDY